MQSSWVVAVLRSLPRVVVLQPHEVVRDLDQPVPAQEEPEAEEWLRWRQVEDWMGSR